MNESQFDRPCLDDRLAAIEWEFHVRAFGEELARVNFLPPGERKAYLERMREAARRKGVNLHHDALVTEPVE